MSKVVSDATIAWDCRLAGALSIVSTETLGRDEPAPLAPGRVGAGRVKVLILPLTPALSNARFVWLGDVWREIAGPNDGESGSLDGWCEGEAVEYAARSVGNTPVGFSRSGGRRERDSDMRV